jgi:hypothetical protein
MVQAVASCLPQVRRVGAPPSAPFTRVPYRQEPFCSPARSSPLPSSVLPRPRPRHPASTLTAARSQPDLHLGRDAAFPRFVSSFHPLLPRSTTTRPLPRGHAREAPPPEPADSGPSSPGGPLVVRGHDQGAEVAAGKEPRRASTPAAAPSGLRRQLRPAGVAAQGRATPQAPERARAACGGATRGWRHDR